MAKKLITMKLPDELVVRIDAAAKAAGMDRTAWVTRACKHDLGQGVRGPFRSHPCREGGRAVSDARVREALADTAARMRCGMPPATFQHVPPGVEK